MASSTYLDHNASSPPRPGVFDAMRPWLSDEFANPSSTHRAGQKARAAIDNARERLASLINAKPSEIIFCSGGTESVALALHGMADAHFRITTSRGEHHAVLHTAARLHRLGAALDWLDLDAEGAVLPRPPKGGLLSLMQANNETGVLHPVEAFAGLAHKHGAHYHCDASQSFGKLPLNVKEAGMDLLSAAGHKFGGPKGAGILYVKDGLMLAPLIEGGEQERGLLAGTENVAAIVGMALAAELAFKAQAEESARLQAWRGRLEAAFKAAIPGLKVNGNGEPRLPGTLSVILPGVESDLMIMRLDQEGIAVSAGAACAAGAVEPSHVLKAMGVADEEARCVLRISLGWSNTEDDVQKAEEAIPRAWKALKNTVI